MTLITVHIELITVTPSEVFDGLTKTKKNWFAIIKCMDELLFLIIYNVLTVNYLIFLGFLVARSPSNLYF